MTREEALKMVKEYAQSVRYERNQMTEMRQAHLVNLLCSAPPSQAENSGEVASSVADYAALHLTPEQAAKDQA